MSAGLETTADLLSVPLEKTAGLLEGTPLPWMFLVTLTLKLGKNLMNKDMTKKEAVLDAIKGADAKLDEIKSMLDDIAAIGKKSFEFITDIRFKQGIERIAALYQAFLNVSPSVAAWQAKMQQFEYHVCEHEKDYNQYMNPKRMEEYLKTLAAEENGIAKMVNALEFILATEAQYLHPMVNFHSYKEDPEAVTRQFQTFNQHVEFLNEVATKEIMKIVPACRTIRFASLCNYKMTNCPLLFKMIGKEDVDEVEAACRHLSPRELLKLLNEPTEGSIMQYYAAGIVPEFALKEPLPLYLAGQMLCWSESPAAERIMRTLLKAGADPNLPRAKGKVSIYNYTKNNWSNDEFGRKAIRILKEFGGRIKTA